MNAATVIDLAPLVNGVILPLLAPALLAVLTWAATRLAALAHIKLQDSHRAVLSAAVTNGIAYAQKALGPTAAVTVNAQIAAAMAYILPKVPEALKSLGVTPDHLAELVAAQLPPAAPAAASAPQPPLAIVDRMKPGLPA